MSHSLSIRQMVKTPLRLMDAKFFRTTHIQSCVKPSMVFSCPLNGGGQ